MMALLKNFTILGRYLPVRCLSTGKDNLVKVTTNETTGISIVSMQKPPVNSLNLEMLETLSGIFVALEKQKCKGMILTSESKSVFCAGLDILEMYQAKPERAAKFWSALQDTWIKLYSSRYPTVAAINGHSPAGGCLLALSCEYRVMVSPHFTIGLNEAQLGIIAPRWFQDCLRNVIGDRRAEIALTTGKMFTAEEALEVGLVDQLVKDKAEAISKAEDFLLSQSGLPSMARGLVKQEFRKDTLERLLNNREKDVKIFVDFITLPKVQQSLELYLQAMKKK